MGYLILIGVVVFICLAIHDCRPDVVKRREDEFLKTLGHDPNSVEAEMIRTKAKHAQLNEQIKKEELKKETAEIVKGAVVGGIVAGEAGAVVGATIAKNKIDNKKK